MISLLLSICIVIGLYTCWHFAAERFGWAATQAPDIICDDNSCTKLADTPYANLLGVPNWYFGTLFYLSLGIVAFAPSPTLRLIALIASCASLAMGSVLVWALIVKLKHFCGYCYLAHAVNASIFTILVVSFF